MIPAKRREFIFSYLHQHKIASIEALCDELSVSHMTIRRDIKVLEDEKKVEAVAGGVQLNPYLKEELPFSIKTTLGNDAKKAIAEAAYNIISDGDSVYLDAGTTVHELAYALAKSKAITVVTNDFITASFLMTIQDIDLYHCGGRVIKQNHSSTGKYACNMIQDMNFDLAFISNNSWDSVRGISTPHEEKVALKREVMKSAERSILLCDSSKYGKYGMYSICPLSNFDSVITSKGLSVNERKAIKETGVELFEV